MLDFFDQHFPHDDSFLMSATSSIFNVSFILLVLLQKPMSLCYFSSGLYIQRN